MSTDFDPKKGDFGVGNGINEYNDQDEQEKRENEKPKRQPSASTPAPLVGRPPAPAHDRGK